MSRLQIRLSRPLLFLCAYTFAQLCHAEAGRVVLEVRDVQQRPQKGVNVGIEGIGSSGVTGDDGKIVLKLGRSTKEGDWVSFSILHSPPGKDLVMVSPWDSRATVPPFADKAENFIKIVVVQRGDKAALESGVVMASLTAKIIKENASRPPSEPTAGDDPEAALTKIAKRYGLSTEELDAQIRAWGKRTLDPFEAGLAALYVRDYPSASDLLQASLKMREEKLAEDQESVIVDQNAIANSEFFLGVSLYEQGKYMEAAEAFSKRLKLTPNDPSVLNGLGVALGTAGDLTSAEAYIRRALSIDTAVSGPDSLGVARDSTDLGELLEAKGNYSEAESQFRKAVTIGEKMLGPNDHNLATYLNNLGGLFEAEGDTASAERLYRRALAMDEKTLGRDHPSVATKLSNVAGVLNTTGHSAEAERLVRRALAIDEKALGPEHPDVAMRLVFLAKLVGARGEASDAESLYRRALAIDEKAFGPESPKVASDLNNLAELLGDERRSIEGEQLIRRALAIDEKAFGPDHPNIAIRLNNLAGLLEENGEFAEVMQIYNRAATIDERSLGPENPHLAIVLNNQAILFESRGDAANAEKLFRRSLAIDEEVFGPENPIVAKRLGNLANLLASQKNYLEAEQLLRRALHIEVNALGPTNPTTIKISQGLDGVIRMAGKAEER